VHSKITIGLIYLGAYDFELHRGMKILPILCLKFVCDITTYERVINNSDAGFEMSATIEAKTKGIWIWCVPHPKVKGRCLALMDTEGLGDPMKVHEI